MGDDEKFTDREWIARFYSASNEELADLNEGDIIELDDPRLSVSAPTPLSNAEKVLKAENERHAQTLKTWSDTDKIGSQVVPTDHRASELYQKPTDGFETEASREKKIRAGQKGYKGQFKIVTYSERPYRRANVYADGYGSGFDLFIRGEKYLRNGYRLTVIGDYIARRDNLLRKIKNQNQRMVPFKPETIESFIKQLQRDGRITANQLDKINVQLTIRQLEGMWEESNAFWKNR